MRLASIHLTNFKRVRELRLDLCDGDGVPLPLVALVGPSRSGKSTLLQAIAATLGGASGRLAAGPAELEWPGFLPGRLAPGAQAVLDVRMAADERAAVERAATLFRAAHPAPDWRQPDPQPVTRLTLRNHGGALAVTAPSEWQVLGLRGRTYARGVVGHLGPGAFDSLGTIVWYHEGRRAESALLTDGSAPGSTLNALRAGLVRLQNDHLLRVARGMEDTLFSRLEAAWQRLFPDSRFVGAEVEGADWEEAASHDTFLLEDDQGRQYELAEMSGAERAVFPILFDLVRWRIHHSVVLIDELELHLHPPLQQRFVSSLPHIGTANQFVLTTHSEDVLAAIPAHHVRRLEEP